MNTKSYLQAIKTEYQMENKKALWIFVICYIAYTAIYVARLNLSMASPDLRDIEIMSAVLCFDVIVNPVIAMLYLSFIYMAVSGLSIVILKILINKTKKLVV